VGPKLCEEVIQTWGTKWCTSRECGYQFSSEFDSRNRETVPLLRSVNLARKQNKAEFLDVIFKFSSQIVLGDRSKSGHSRDDENCVSLVFGNA
jgi:hypothetical protein